MAKELAPRPYVVKDTYYGSVRRTLNIPYKTWLQINSEGTDTEVISKARKHVAMRFGRYVRSRFYIDPQQLRYGDGQRIVWGNYLTRNGRKSFVEKLTPDAADSNDPANKIKIPTGHTQEMKIVRTNSSQNLQESLFNPDDFEEPKPSAYTKSPYED